MKPGEISKISSLIQSVENQQGKLNKFQKFIKKICLTDNANWDQSSNSFRQVLAQKKITKSHLSNHPKTNNSVEKTVKIKKNRQKKKKKSVIIPQLSLQKNFTHELCGCCSGKLDNTVANDGYQSDDQYYESDTRVDNIIQQIGEELLESFYDQIDKSIIRIMKDASSNHSRTFLKLVKKLADIYQDFVQDLREQVDRQFQDEPMLSLEANWIECDQFKNYIITRFPLLKDFIQNFSLSDLDQKQNEDFLKMQCQNPFVQSIYLHMQKIAARKSKKKTKRQKQKIKQSTQMNKFDQQVIKPEDALESYDIVQRIQNLKIIQKQRSTCYFDMERLNSLQKQMMMKSKAREKRDDR